MKIKTRRQLTEEVARRIYEDFRILDMEDTTDASRDWQMAENVVSAFLDDVEEKYRWQKEHQMDDYRKFDIFIRNYDENATDRVMSEQIPMHPY